MGREVDKAGLNFMTASVVKCGCFHMISRFTPQFPISSHRLPLQGNSQIKIIRRYAWSVLWIQWISKLFSHCADGINGKGCLLGDGAYH